jgi:hypothetical protein
MASGRDAAPLASEVAGQAARASARELALGLDPGGDGELGPSLDRAMANGVDAALARSEARFAAHFPQCANLDAAHCLEVLTRVAARGAADGVADTVRVPLLVLAFGAGVLTAAVLFLAVMELRRTRPQTERRPRSV